MSNITKDPLFPVATRAPSGRESLRANLTAGDPFRSHLNRATDVAEPIALAKKITSEPTESEIDEPFEAQTGQQETSTAEQEPTAAATDASEPVTEEPAEKETDEVTLTAAAEAQAVAENLEVAVAANQEVGLQVVAQSFSTDNPQQLQGQAAVSTGTIAGEAVAAAKADATALSARVPGGEAASKVEELRVNTQVVTGTLETTTSTAATQSTVSSRGQDEAKKSQTLSISTSPPSQQSLHRTTETLPELDAIEKSPSTATGKLDVPTKTVTGDFVIATEAEIALINLDSASEPIAGSPNAPASTTEGAAAAGRSVGTLLTDKLTPVTEATVEASTPTIDQAKFLQRVGGAIRSAQQRDGEIQLRLSPPELGTLRINIVMKEGILTAHLETETAAARTVLLDNLPALRERLAEQEIRIDKFDVDVGREGQQQTDDSDTDDRQTDRARSQSKQPSTQDRASSIGATESDPTQPVTASGLDVRI